MGFLSERDTSTLRERFDAEMAGEVAVKVFSEPATGLYLPGRRQCVSCQDTEALVKEVAELSERIDLEIVGVHEDPERAAEWKVEWTPTIAIAPGTDSADAGVRLLGIPAGFEFVSFIETVISASQGDGYGLRPETLEKLSGLDRDLEIKVFSTPT